MSSTDPSEFEPVFQFVRMLERRFELRLHGAMPLGWAATVASHLSELGCDVDLASASVDSRGVWSGHIAGTRPLSLVDLPEGFDLLAPPRSAPIVVPRVLASIVVRDRTTGSLRVELTASDAVGLLAALLSSFGMLGLFPRVIDVRTTAGEARDKFELSGIGGREVSERVERELRRSLERWAGSKHPSIHVAG